MSEPIRTLHSWSRSEYERMVDAGVFHPESRLELLDGEIIEMGPQKSPHATGTQLVEEALRRCFGPGFHLRGQMPLAIDDRSEPEPDVAVVKGSIRDFTSHHPETALLLVEVADTSLALDRMKKAAVYARNNIPEYWILNLRDRTLEVQRNPVGDAYAEQSILTADQDITPLAAPDAKIQVSELLP